MYGLVPQYAPRGLVLRTKVSRADLFFFYPGFGVFRWPRPWKNHSPAPWLHGKQQMQVLTRGFYWLVGRWKTNLLNSHSQSDHRPRAVPVYTYCPGFILIQAPFFQGVLVWTMSYLITQAIEDTESGSHKPSLLKVKYASILQHAFLPGPSIFFLEHVHC